MNRLIASTLCALATSTLSASAGPVSFVSTQGVDSGDCSSINAPCRSLTFAVSQTAPHGEVILLNFGDFGRVIIRKSISVTGAPGAGMIGTEFGGSSPLISTDNGPDDIVHINGLTLDGGVYNGAIGMQFTGGSVKIRNCVIRNFQVWALAGGGKSIVIEDSKLTSAGHLIRMGSNRFALNRISAADSSYGIETDGPATISESSFESTSSAIYSPLAAPIFLARTTIRGNNIGVDGAQILSAGNNVIRFNNLDWNVPIVNVGTQ